LLLAGLLLPLAVCGQNLLANGGFATDLAAWQSFSDNGSAVWSSIDSGGSASSGSAFLTGTNATGGVLNTFLAQCVPVAAGTAYTVSDRVRFLEGQSTTGWAEIAIYWVSAGNCVGGYISGSGLLAQKVSSGVWESPSDTFTAPAGAVAANVQLGIDKIEPGGTLSASFDNVRFEPASAAAETLAGYLPVVASVHGAFGSNFKTSLQLMNPNFSAISGHLVFHPAGVPGSASDPTIGYSLAPRQTFSWDDVVAAMGQTGVGSVDLYVSAGAAPPIAVTRIFNDAGAAGTSGFTEPLIRATDVQGGIGVSVTGFLVGPADTSRFRFNIGIRTVGAPVSVTATVLDSGGTAVASVTHSYPANYFEQKSSADFLGGFVLGNDHSIQITFSGGGLIVYGATADDVTNDPSAQFMPYIFAIA
jgi:hypothetical protein